MIFRTLGILVILLFVPALVSAQEAPEAEPGTLSLATNPEVMVYIDGQRIGMSPLLNHSLAAGEHRVSLLLIQADGQRLRAEYRALLEGGRTTMASLNLVNNAPAPGEVRVLAPEAAQAVAAQSPSPPETATPEVVAPVEPPHQPIPPVDVAAVIRSDPNVAVVATPQPLVDASRQVQPPQLYGLGRELVQEGMESLRPVVEQCMNGASGIVRVRVIIQTDGGVTDVEAQGMYRGTEIGQCIENGFPEEAAFPFYAGDPIPVVYPYRVSAD